MMLKLLLKTASMRRTGKLEAVGEGVDWVSQAVRHENVQSDVYVFQRFMHMDPSQTDARRVVGTKVLVFEGKKTGQRLFVYGQESPFQVVASSVGMGAPEFSKLWSQAVLGLTQLEVRSALFVWGSTPVLERNISGLTRSLDFYEEQLEDLKFAAQMSSPSTNSAPARSGRSRPSSQPSPYRKPITKPAPRVAPVTSRPRKVVSTPSQPVEAHDSFADFAFLAMFPEVAPLYRPNSLMAWYLWSQHQDDVRERGGQFSGGGASGSWDGVPGFPEASSQRVVPCAEGHRVELLNDQGQGIGSFVVHESGGNTCFTTPQGQIFTISSSASQPQIHYENDSLAFVWDGQNAPLAGSPSDIARTLTATDEASRYTETDAAQSRSESFSLDASQELAAGSNLRSEPASPALNSQTDY